MADRYSKFDDMELIVMAQAGDTAAAGALALRHRRFVWQQARRVARQEADVEDLVQEGLIHLIEAIPKFDTTVGVKFLTYAGKFIWTRLRHAYNRSTLIRSPQNYDPARELPVVVSLHDILHESDNDSELVEIVPAPLIVMPSEDDARDLAKMRECIADLKPRSRRIIEMRMAGATLKQIGAEMGVTRERIRQMETAAANTIRRRMGLPERPYLNKPNKKRPKP